MEEDPGGAEDDTTARLASDQYWGFLGTGSDTKNCKLLLHQEGPDERLPRIRSDETSAATPGPREQPPSPSLSEVNSVRRYFRELEAHLSICPENYGDFVSPDCLMIKPTGQYMGNSATTGGASREEMCKTFLTWLAPQKILALENVRFLGSGTGFSSACCCQIRMFQHFKYGDSEEEDVAVFTFVLENKRTTTPAASANRVETKTFPTKGGEEASPSTDGALFNHNSSNWQAVLIQRALGAPQESKKARHYPMELQPAPSCDAKSLDDLTAEEYDKSPYLNVRLRDGCS
ncbi:unnamed protein product [Amoebophrya sp. A120]|nr:unnamed protein product [Amoebophrya sp. A120]|eukprot:GSA120T00019904001.1